MGVTAAWEGEDHTVIRLTFVEPWTNEELHSAGTESILMIRSVKQPVYVISDFSASTNPPIGVLWKARDLNRMRPPNWAAGITITSDPLVKNLIELFRHIYLGQRGKNIFVVRTNPEALELIDKLKKEKRVG
jgi:hypothetical protein